MSILDDTKIVTAQQPGKMIFVYVHHSKFVLQEVKNAQDRVQTFEIDTNEVNYILLQDLPGPAVDDGASQYQ